MELFRVNSLNAGFGVFELSELCTGLLFHVQNKHHLVSS